MTDPDTEMAIDLVNQIENGNCCSSCHGEQDIGVQHPSTFEPFCCCGQKKDFEELIAQALRSVRQAENVDPEQVNELMKTLTPSLSSFERNFCAYKLTERLNKGDLRHNRLKEKP